MTKKYMHGGSTYKPAQNITLYARWSEDVIKVNFNSNGGKGNMEEINVRRGNATKLTKNTFENTDYIFKEWNTSPDGTGTVYIDEAQIQNVTEDITLYAIWKEEIIANLVVTNNKFTEGTKITLGGEAKAKGIQKIALKVGNNILYEEIINGAKTTYSKSNLGLEALNQDNLANLDFYNITLQLEITSTTRETGNRDVQIYNYTVGNGTALNTFAKVVNSGNPLNEETITQLRDINTASNYIQIGGTESYRTWNGKYFAGTYDGKGRYINVTQRSIDSFYSHGIFGLVLGGTVKNLTAKGYQPDRRFFRSNCRTTKKWYNF